MDLLSPLSMTSVDFSKKIFAALGKGREHAILIYKNFHRNGMLECDSSFLPNGKLLFEQIRSQMDCSFGTFLCAAEEEGTTKFVMQTDDGYPIEAVVIRMKGRNTLCVSSQIGCAVSCVFCKTGTMGFVRNLSVKEIVAQLFIARHQLKEKIHNIVFMGMGEPFSNYEEVLTAAQIFADPFAGNIGISRMTIATSGNREKIAQFAREKRMCPNLAISINAPTDELRKYLMPNTASDTLFQLRQSMEDYCEKTGKEILISYVLLKNMNDSEEMAERLASYLRGLPVRINIIPFNGDPFSRFSAPSIEKVDAFISHLRKDGYLVFLRSKKGGTIQAACGQLVSKAIS